MIKLACSILLFTLCFSKVYSQWQAPANAEDSLELLRIYEATNGAGWTTKYGWDTRGWVKNWFGVSLDQSTGRVTGLVLRNNNLSGTIDKVNLPLLRTVELNNNKLTGNIPDFLSTDILNIWLDGNQLSGTLTDFKKYTQLYDLRLNNNQLTGSIPADIYPSSLMALFLNNNQFTGSIPIFNLPALSSLTLNNNQLTGNIPDINLPSLWSLQLNDNKLSGTVPSLNLPMLRHLRFHNNLLDGIGVLNVHPDCSIYLFGNKFDFTDLEPFVIKWPNSIYGAQANIPLNRKGDTLSVSAGGTLKNNTYTWRRTYSPIYKQIKGDSILIDSTQGKFWVTVTNDIATQLSLVSDELELGPFKMLDPNPSFIGSDGIFFADYSKLDKYATVVGGAADGVTKIILYTKSSKPVKFKIDNIKDGLVGNLAGTEMDDEVIIEPVNGEIIAVYTVPDGIGPTLTSYPKREIFVKASFVDGTNQIPIAIHLVSPPVVLVHGMWSGPEVWRTGGFVNALLNRGFDQPRPVLADYSSASSNTFHPTSSEGSVGRTAVFWAVRESLRNLRDWGYAGVQVDIVAHSLGGLMTRSYMQHKSTKAFYNYFKGHVHKLITLGTPYKGSPIGPELWALRDPAYFPDKKESFVSGVKSTLVSKILSSQGMPIGTCHRDFYQFSDAFMALKPDTVKAFAVVGNYRGTSIIFDNEVNYTALNRLLYSVTGKYHFEIFKSPASCSNNNIMESDLIVSIGSQKGGLSHNKMFYSTNHSEVIPGNQINNTETTRPEIQDHVISLLLSNKSEEFAPIIPAPSSFTSDCGIRTSNPLPASNNEKNARVANQNNYIKITSPVSGSVYQQGSGTTINLTFETVGNIVPDQSLFMVNKIGWFEPSGGANPYTYSLTIKDSVPIGKLSILALTRDTAGIVYFDTIAINIQPSGTFKSIEATPEKIFLDSVLRTRTLKVDALFEKGNTIIRHDITDSTAGTTYIPKTGNIFTVSKNGIITARAPGTDTLIIANFGMQLKIPVIVNADFSSASLLPNSIQFPIIEDVTVTDGGATLFATATSGDEVSFSLMSGSAIVENGVVTFSTPGKISVKAKEDGNAYFAAAADLTRTFCVKPLKPKITLDGAKLLSTTSIGNQWYLNGNPISNAVDSVYTPVATGVYTLRITHNSCNSDIADPIQYAYTSISNIVNDDRIKIFPIPVREKLTISNTIVGKNLSMNIYDLSGKLVYANKRFKGNINVDVSGLAQATYFVEIRNEDHKIIYRNKVIKL